MSYVLTALVALGAGVALDELFAKRVIKGVETALLGLEARFKAYIDSKLK